MKISIVTPNYNYGEFLIKAIKNVFAQTEANESPVVEHIIIDGGSTDNSVKYMQEWDKFIETIPADRKSRYSFSWVSEKDRGQTDAINKGLRKSTGDIMCWLNADEEYKPNALKEIANAFEKHPKVDVFYGEIEFTKEDGTPLRVKKDHRYSFGVLLHYGCYIPSAATFWRRRAYEIAGDLDFTYKVTMDYEYWVRLAKLGCKFKFLPKTIASFAWHENNISTVFNDKRIQECHKVKMLYGVRLPFGSKFQEFYFKIANKYWLLWRQCLKTLRKFY